MSKNIYTVLIATIMLHGGILLWLLKINDFRIDKFIHAGDRFTQTSELSEKIDVLADSDGYDGQFYYRLALNPLTSHGIENGIRLDQPALRHQRILYPLLAHILSLGDIKYIPQFMVLVNFFALAILAVIGVLWARKLGASAVLGGLITLYPGLLFSFSHNLTEILTAVLGLATLLFFHKKSYAIGSLFLTLALLTRETALIYAFGIAVAILLDVIRKRSDRQRSLLLDKKEDKKKIASIAVPLTIFLVWQITLWQIWGNIPLLLGSSLNLNWPFYGLIKQFPAWTLSTFYNHIELIFIAATLLLSLAAFKKSKVPLTIKASWITAFLIFTLWGPALWSEDLTFMRAFSELFFLSFLILLGAKNRVKIYYGASLTIIFFLVFYLRLV